MIQRADVRGRADTTYDKILLPTDGMECSVKAADHGLAFVEAFDATLHVLYVVDVGIITPALEDHVRRRFGARRRPRVRR